MANPKNLKKQNLDLYAEEREGKSVAFRSYPPTLQLEPTTRCTQSCRVCARNYYDKALNPPVDMQPWVLEKVEPALLRAGEVVLGGYGEPLIAENFEGIVEFAKERDCEVEIITGVVPLKSKRARELIFDLRVDRLRLSIDGVTPKTLRTLRGVDADEVFSIMRTLAARAESGGLELSINFTANLINIAELPEVVRRARSWGVKKVFVFFQKIYTRAQSHTSVFLDPHRTSKQIESAREIASDQKIELIAPEIARREVACSQPLELLFIRADAEVLGCCSAVFAGHRWRLPLGNLGDSDIMSLWNHQTMQAFRRAFYENRAELYPEPCRSCAFRINSVESHFRFLDDR